MSAKKKKKTSDKQVLEYRQSSPTQISSKSIRVPNLSVATRRGTCLLLV